MTFLRLIPYQTPDRKTKSAPVRTGCREHRTETRDARRSVQEWLANDHGAAHGSSNTDRGALDEATSSSFDGLGDSTPSHTTSSSRNVDFLSTTTSDRESSTAIPPSLPDDDLTHVKLPFRAALARLENAVKSTRDAESLHAYEIGVFAALKSMECHWSNLSAQHHISNSEKRIFRREAERLRELLSDVELETLENGDRVARRQDREDQAWVDLRASTKGMSEWEDEDVTRLTDSISQLSLSEPLEAAIKKKQAVRIYKQEKDSESEDSNGLPVLSARAPEVYGVLDER
ncbi:hypothetical protein QBC34DRAFT_438085 [Podospora aff. communis PSN243]|uniref:Uncharacterized protein n=1 Tax=Podospora aff. communis PSN243 TaxID=3040156 RepID=A0AAV9GNV6_9PEZI|nr:hypothetical protein QBC34DRAFT_438085 [Podospora aff. communis PSN243]